jgi:predicted lipoprotein with Yx(FWY)xxD motif
MRTLLGVMSVVVAVLAAACAADDTGAGGQADATVAPDPLVAATDPPEAETAADADTTVAVNATDLGDILVDGDGNTLYMFVPDEQGASTCYDDCEQNWPPLTGTAAAGDGTDQSLLATVERDDGMSQVTYNDWPLYYFAGDAAAGDTAGQGIGDVWYVLDASGEPVREGGSQEGAY